MKIKFYITRALDLDIEFTACVVQFPGQAPVALPVTDNTTLVIPCDLYFTFSQPTNINNSLIPANLTTVSTGVGGISEGGAAQVTLMVEFGTYPRT
jgi:hypothetical protein